MAIRSLNCGSLLFDCEVEEGQHGAAAASEFPAQVAALAEKLAYMSQPTGDFGCKLLQDVRNFKRALQREDCPQDAVVLALKLSLVGYTATVRTALGGGSACFRNLRHEFISVRGDDGSEYIVDPAFRDHFQIPHPTRLYEQLLAAVPAEFVGSSSRLVPLVQCLCMEMAESFSAKGLTLPPWRRAQAMLSKWLPARSKDTTYSGASDSEGASPDSCMDQFTRISELQVTSLAIQRTASKGLLSNRLSAPSSACDARHYSRSSSNSSSSLRSAGTPSQLKRSSEGMVCKQPPVHWSQPPSYKVRVGGVHTQQPAQPTAAAAPAAAQQRAGTAGSRAFQPAVPADAVARLQRLTARG